MPAQAGLSPSGGEGNGAVRRVHAEGRRRRGPVPRGVRARERGARTEPPWTLRLQLPGARCRQHGAPPHVRHRGSERTLPVTARARRRPQHVHDDRARQRGLEPRMALDDGRSPRAGMGHPRAQVVLHRRRRSEFRHLYGRDESRARREVRAREHDHRADGHPEVRARAEPVRDGRSRGRLGQPLGDRV